MKQVVFGNTGIKVSEMCLGTMMFGDRCDIKESEKILSTAMDNGVNLIDTAESYMKGKTEEILGSITQGKRDKLFIVTKGHISETMSLEEKVNASLERLKTDYIDFYLIHWPKEKMDVYKVMESLDKIVKSGKVRFIGCSNYPLWLLAYSNEISLINNFKQFSVLQIPYNIIERGVEVDVLPYTKVKNMAVISYRPLVMGLLTGKYNPDKPIPENSRGATDERIPMLLNKYSDGIRKFLELAYEKEVTPAQLAISWVRFSDFITAPIVGVSSVNQLETSLKAFETDITQDEYEKINSFFSTDVKEESLGKYKSLRRNIIL